MIDFSKVKGMTIPEGVVTEIKDSLGRVIWAISGGKVILEVEKITSDTYAGETTYTGESFILLDIYPKTNGTVKVTYGGLTKTITDTSGAAEPNAQQVYFGTFNGVSDSVTTPASGELTITGSCRGYGRGSYTTLSGKSNSSTCQCIIGAVDMGEPEVITNWAFANCTNFAPANLPKSLKEIGLRAFYNCTSLAITSLPNGITSIGDYAFADCDSITTLTIPITTPPTLGEGVFNGSGIAKIIVPNGCSAAYKAATGWSTYADYIVEAS